MNDPVLLFMDQVRLRPNHPAVVQDGTSITYDELGLWVRRLATSLANIGEKPRALIYLPKGASAYAAMFATLMAGGYYSPVNMDAPIQRHIEILNLFQPDVIISTKKTLSTLLMEGFDAEFVDIENLPSAELGTFPTCHELAYVIFTSGSTGQPKGVMISRASLAHYTEWALNAMHVSPEDRWSQHPNIAFDLSVLDIYGALCGGATLYPIVSKKDKLLPADFIKRNKLTIWNSVPSVIDLMIKARQVTNDHFASLRLLTFCGEPLYARHLEAIFSTNKRVMVHNTYGPTEATVSCSLIRLASDDYMEYSGNSIALGQPIPGMEFVLEGDSPEEGELLISGEQLALGYWQNESETARAFIDASINGAAKRTYRTGDWVVKKNGEYYFSGRMDSQVKIHGNRVELDEIDSIIFKLGFGNSCTVFVNDQLHSFIETKNLPEFMEFKRNLARHLPEYEIPAYIYAIGGFPVNSNDKIDRRQLCGLINRDQTGRRKD